MYSLSVFFYSISYSFSTPVRGRTRSHGCARVCVSPSSFLFLSRRGKTHESAEGNGKKVYAYVATRPLPLLLLLPPFFISSLLLLRFFLRHFGLFGGHSENEREVQRPPPLLPRLRRDSAKVLLYVPMYRTLALVRCNMCRGWGHTSKTGRGGQ